MNRELVLEVNDRIASAMDKYVGRRMNAKTKAEMFEDIRKIAEEYVRKEDPEVSVILNPDGSLMYSAKIPNPGGL